MLPLLLACELLHSFPATPPSPRSSPLDQLRDLIVIRVGLVVFPALLLLHALVALCQSSQGREAVGAELIQDPRDELRQLFVFAVAVDCEGVGGDGGVDCVLLGRVGGGGGMGEDIPLGAAKWMTFPSSLNMFTSSMAWMGWTFIFLRAVWSFLSSTPEEADFEGAFFILRRGVPLPLCGGCGLVLEVVFISCGGGGVVEGLGISRS